MPLKQPSLSCDKCALQKEAEVGMNEIRGFFSGCLIPEVDSPTVNYLFLLMTELHHFYVLMAQSTSC